MDESPFFRAPLANLASELPFDLDVLDGLLSIAVVASGGPRAAGLLLDGERRGRSLQDLAISLADVTRRCSSQLAEPERLQVLQDLAIALGGIGAARPARPDALLSTLLPDGCLQGGEIVGAVACLNRAGAEGFVLEWLAVRLARTHQIAWAEILKAADELALRRPRELQRG